MIRFYSVLQYFVLINLRFFFVLSYDDNSLSSTVSNDVTWKARWFPFGPGETDMNPVVQENTHFNMMQEPNPACDNGKLNLEIDWNGSTDVHECYTEKLYPDPYVRPMLTCKHIPKTYSAIHVCINSSIIYDEDIPTYGPHRPVWAQYGEYKYLPKQRWLHNAEHGAVIMLYHPCAKKSEVSMLKKLVRNCLYRHIITPSPYVSEIRPLVLVTWGCRLEMSYVHIPIVKNFIKRNALRGSEQISKNGLYNESLIQSAEIISDSEDTNLCPSVNHM